ncbi:MAG TPA: hypothetical protein VFQ85_16420 [Mycobacteriales bacterium]|jgi:hypothetical protein|nr:hypothetical protein [Mycobacteriales bacterium]
MENAETKAKLVAAYASGARPKFVNVLPDGMNELWQLTDLALVIPLVPPDAPADLEYALRLRRDAMIGGRCDGCGAVPSLTQGPDLGDVPVATALFNHRKTCPAADENTLVAYERYQKATADLTPNERMDAANARTRRQVAEFVGDRAVRAASTLEPVAVDLLDRLLPDEQAVPLCDHLAVDPVQTWHCIVAEGRWMCTECWARRGEEVAAGRFRLQGAEEFTCDLCRRYTPSTLGPLLLRVDTFMMHGAACGRCLAQYAADGE